MKLDLKLTGCRAITMDPARPAAYTIGIWQGRIAGLDEQVEDLPAAETVDLGNAVVLPGFIDAHTHLAWNGRRTIDITGLTAVTQILDHLADAPGTGWIEASGYDRRIMDRPLTALDLDRVSGDRPTYVADLSGHACVVNSLVLKQLPEITSDGWLTENEQLAARTLRLPYSLDEITAELHTSARQVLSEGVTMCAEAGIGAGLIASSPLEAAAYQRAQLPIRVQLMVSAHVLHDVVADPSDGIPRAIDLGLHTGFGNDMLSIGALKLWTDGGMMARTAALSEPYLGSGNAGRPRRVRGVPAGGDHRRPPRGLAARDPRDRRPRDRRHVGRGPRSTTPTPPHQHPPPHRTLRSGPPRTTRSNRDPRHGPRGPADVPLRVWR